MSFFSELKRRNVFRIGAAYVIVAWLLLQLVSILLPTFDAPEWVMRVIVLILGVGFVVALFIAWAFEITPEGLKPTAEVNIADSIRKQTGQTIQRIAITGLVLALVIVVVDSYLLEDDPASTAPSVDSAVVDSAVAEELIPNEDISIAVLAFQSMSDDAEQEYFSDGISEELLNLLAQIPDLHVSSRTSSFSFKGQNIDLPTIAEALGVNHILEGSVRKSGNQIRITAQLIEVATDSHLWSETYTRELIDVFAVQDEIAANVVEALKIELLGETVVVQEGYRTDNVDAHNAYLLGRNRLVTRRINDLRAAREYFQTAIELDPNYAAPYAGRADAINLLHYYGATDYNDVLTNSIPAIERALTLDSTLGEAYAARGFIAWAFEADVNNTAIADLRRATELSPNYATAYHWYGQALQYLKGDPETGHEVILHGIELDPLSPMMNAILAISFSWLGELEQARESFERSIEISPDFANGYTWRSFLKASLGNIAEAIKDTRIAANVDTLSPIHPIQTGWHYLALGTLEQAQDFFELAADLYEDDTLSQFYEEFIPLVLNAEDPERLLGIIEGLPVHRVQNEWAIRAAVLQNGNLEAVRNYLSRTWPELINSDMTAVGPHNYHMAVDLAWLLQQEGDEQQANQLLDTSLMVLRQTPPEAPVNLVWERPIAEVRILALQGKDEEALLALQRAVDGGWRIGTWILEGDPLLASISEHPGFIAVLDEIKADMAIQLEQVRAMERSGEIPPLPSAL
jgi:TolB-like protein